mgnify:CR=1 FL=1
MAGIYIHIPFCKQACHYCNFHFSASTKLLDPMVKAICKEIELQQSFFEEPNLTIDTIYFGGGTPSLLPTQDTEQILAAIKKHFTLSPTVEITLEANPEDRYFGSSLGLSDDGKILVVGARLAANGGHIS